MKKGQIVKCVRTRNRYLTKGKDYVVVAGAGNNGMYGFIDRRCESLFEIIDDEGDTIFQASLNGLHGSFEVVS